VPASNNTAEMANVPKEMVVGERDEDPLLFVEVVAALEVVVVGVVDVVLLLPVVVLVPTSAERDVSEVKDMLAVPFLHDPVLVAVPVTKLTAAH
jgi:hypothetical protein